VPGEKLRLSGWVTAEPSRRLLSQRRFFRRRAIILPASPARFGAIDSGCADAVKKLSLFAYPSVLEGKLMFDGFTPSIGGVGENLNEKRRRKHLD
jgi:hypothetical protein